MDEKVEQMAIFWCSLLHPVIFGEIPEGEVHRFLKELSLKEITFPNGKFKKPALSTLKRKLKTYQTEGFKALARKRRSDRGKIRSVPEEILNKAIELKKDQPYRSNDAINRILEADYNKTIKKSTLYRHLHEAGATKLKMGVSQVKVRKRWTRDKTHDLWIGDFEDGPYVFNQGESVPTYLSLFIDCHSRYVVEGRYYFRKSLDILIDSLLRAWAVHGKSNGLYVDQAKVYLSNALKAACYDLNIDLLHRARGDPAPGGLVERMFGTCQSQFEAEVRAGSILTINELNSKFAAYLAIAYHQRKHSETGESPEMRYHKGLGTIRKVNINEVAKYFMKEDIRTVHRDFSDVQINSAFYRVAPELRGDKVKVLFDRFSQVDEVFIYSLKGEFPGKGKYYTRDYGEPEQKIYERKKPKYDYLKLLEQKHAEVLNQKAQGIDYRKVTNSEKWSFTAFISKLALLMGKTAGLSSFNTEELTTLKKTYNRLPKIDEKILINAWNGAKYKTIPHLVVQLQSTLIKGEN